MAKLSFQNLFIITSHIEIKIRIVQLKLRVIILHHLQIASIIVHLKLPLSPILSHPSIHSHYRIPSIASKLLFPDLYFRRISCQASSL